MNQLVKQKFLVLIMLVIGAVSLIGCQQEGPVSNVTVKVTDESGSSLPAQVKLVPENAEVTDKIKQKLSKTGEAVQFKNVPTGVYQLKISKDGYLSTSNYLVVKEDNTTKTVKLKKELPTVTVKPMIKGLNKAATVEIFKSGTKVASEQGTQPNFRLEPGVYEIKVKKDEYLTSSKYISLGQDADLIREINLRLDAPTLTVKPMLGDKAGEAKVEILQNGEKITTSEGKTVEFRLKEGVYTVRVSKEGYQTTTKYLMLKDSGAEVTLKLQEAEKKTELNNLLGANLITNSNFDQAIDTDSSQVKQGQWSFYAGESFGGSGQAEITDGRFKINIEQPGGPVYALQLIQTPVKIEKGTAYKLTYQAKVTEARNIAVKVGGTADRNWADYTGGITDKLTTEMNTYEHYFTMNQKTDPQARVEFQLGKEQPNVWIDKVKLQPVEKKWSNNLLANSKFDQAIDTDSSQVKKDNWSFYAGESFGGAGQAEITDGKFKINIGQPGGPVHALQLIQTPVKIEKGTAYKLTYQAKAAEARNIAVKVGGTADRNWADYTGGITDELTTELNTYEHVFVMDEKTDPQARIEFQLGKEQANVWLDNIKLEKYLLDNDEKFSEQQDQAEEKSAQNSVEAYPRVVKNGDFSSGTKHWGTEGSIETSASEGRLKAEIEDVGSETYSTQLNQFGLQMVKGVDYRVTFQAKADQPRKVKLGLGKSLDSDPWYIDYLGDVQKTYQLGTEMQTYSFEFNMTEESYDDAKLTFELGNIEGGNAKTTVYLDNVKVVPDYKDPQLSREDKIDKLLSLMTLEEKVGQMIQAERKNITPEQVKKYKVGSILSGGGSTPDPNTPENWADMYKKFQASALETRLGIPMIYGVDAVHGHNNVKGATIFPHNIGLGATRNPEIVQKVGKITAKETAATGMDWNFSPCVAVVRDIRWGRTYESFGETPALQNQLAGAYVAGLQGPNAEMSGSRMVATAKHFVGDGGARWGTGDAGYKIDRGNLSVDEETLRRIHLPGYLEAMEEDVGTIMASYSSWQGKKLHEHKYLLTDVLKEELGFKGFVVSDWNAIDEIDKSTFHGKVVTAVNAGVDMFMQPSNWRKFSQTLTKAVENGEVSEERINDAVRRILRIKYKADLFKEPLVKRELLDSVGSDPHREVAREAVRESLVLLKNQQELLPLDKGADVYVAGSNADDLGSQCGGWTIKWQGATGDITEGTTILEGIEQSLNNSGQVVNDISDADVGVVVVGEDPYTEGKGDDGKLQLSTSDLEAIEEVKEAGKPVAVVMVSGRPLMINDYIDNWDAFVAAWLPGTEGQGVADVLFGDYNFEGQLPVTWPKSIDQVPINKGDGDYNPLFEYGAGLKMDLKE